MIMIILICIVESNGNLLSERTDDKNKHNTELEEKPPSADQLTFYTVDISFFTASSLLDIPYLANNVFD